MTRAERHCGKRSTPAVRDCKIDKKFQGWLCESESLFFVADPWQRTEVAFIFDGANYHIEEWTYSENGKEETTRFDFRRKQ